jgi:hypothetical protein
MHKNIYATRIDPRVSPTPHFTNRDIKRAEQAVPVSMVGSDHEGRTGNEPPAVVPKNWRGAIYAHGDGKLG